MSQNDRAGDALGREVARMGLAGWGSRIHSDVMRVAVVFAAALTVVTGCTHDRKERPNAVTDEERQPPSASIPAKGNSGTAWPLWQQSFALPEWRFTRRFHFTAPNPATHSFQVRFEQQPASAQVFVRIRTLFGDLNVFDPNVQPFVANVAIRCEDRGTARACLMSFPNFVAERAGRWTVVVEKLSKTSADVHLEIRFTRVARSKLDVATSSDEGLESKQRFDTNGIAFAYPSRWFVTLKPLSAATNPAYRFAVSSVPVRRTAADEGPCLPGVARQLPPDAVLAYLREALGVDRTRSLPRMPRRAGFPLPAPAGDGLCGFQQGGGLWYPFKDANRVFYLGVYVGPEASTASRRALKDLLDGMEIRAR
jgi:hypothetical protein